MSKLVTLKIEKLAERDQFVKALVYGESGVGKTVFASTAPRPILWLESEGGTNSIAERDGIDIARVTGLDTYREALSYLYENPGLYKTVVLDSFTETQSAVLKEIMRAVAADNRERSEFNPLYQDYQQLVGIMREIARGFRDLPMHVVITALTREDKDEMTGRSKVRPRLSPALAEELPGYMDVVGYLYAATTKKGEVDAAGVETNADDDGPTVVRNMLLKPTGKYIAKCRAPADKVVPDFLRDPNFADLLDVLSIENS